MRIKEYITVSKVNEKKISCCACLFASISLHDLSKVETSSSSLTSFNPSAKEKCSYCFLCTEEVLSLKIKAS